jgi:hypothetical protein
MPRLTYTKEESDRHKRRRKERLEQNLCPQYGCDESLVIGKRSCQIHLDASAKQRLDRKVSGFCIDCDHDEPRVNGTMRCQRHLELAAQYARKWFHAFDDVDELRFQAVQAGALPCDWCGQFIKDETPHVDHDHECCDALNGKHCYFCTRGFVHNNCNSKAIVWFEWYEQQTGVVLPMLADYRKRFPVPRAAK